MFLVTGATGNVGRHVVDCLLAAGATVRATSRRPATAGLPSGVEIVSPDETGSVMDGVSAAFVNPAAAGEDLERFLAQAKACGVGKVVLLSTSAVLDESSPIGVHHRTLEEQVANSGMAWTTLRPGVFNSNTLSWAAPIRAEGVVRAPYGGARIAPIDERDIAAVAARAMLTDDLLGASPVLTGPELMTQADQVRHIGRAIGVPLRFEEVTSVFMREAMVRAGLPEQAADGLLRYYAQAAAHPVEPSPAVTALSGATPHTFAAWAADHAAAFGGPA